jgi:hypothetical protein
VEKIINSVLAEHSDFNYYEIQEICEDFLDEIPKKIKEVTKIKRLRKYTEKEFELGMLDFSKDVAMLHLYNNEKNYGLENIPKYLFE